MDHPVSQEGFVDKIDQDQAEIRLNGQILRWPVDRLPQSIKVGDTVRVIVTSPELENMDREVLAKAILNEILRGQDSK
ncbi:MAG: hypothetical protein WC734_02510 [Patescibacteria group bacterium]|jgi:hypothetical protein